VPDCTLSVIVKVAESDPLVFGLKLTLMVQLLLLPAASERIPRPGSNDVMRPATSESSSETPDNLIDSTDLSL